MSLTASNRVSCLPSNGATWRRYRLQLPRVRSFPPALISRDLPVPEQYSILAKLFFVVKYWAGSHVLKREEATWLFKSRRISAA